MSAPTRSLEPHAGRLPEKGDLIGGKYRMERVLGLGGMGIVVEAAHVDLQQRVAIKVMLPELVHKPEFAARFLREGRAAATLRSDHAARIIDIGRRADEAPYLVMELLEGDDLEKLVRARGPLPVEEAVDYVLQACDAIAEAHSHGIIHRDLKPSNLFLYRRAGAPPTIKVLDFGISKATKLNTVELDSDMLTATDATLGSPRYISPEQLRDARTVDARTDIWSLGLVLHWMLTGKLAFEADTLGAHLSMLLTDPPTPLRARRPDAPAELEAIIQRCLGKQVDERFQTIGQLAQALLPFASPSGRAIVPNVVASSELTPLPIAPPLRVRIAEPPPAAAVRMPPPELATHATWSGLDDPTKARSHGPRRLAGVAGAALAIAVIALIIALPRARLGGGGGRPPVHAPSDPVPAPDATSVASAHELSPPPAPDATSVAPAASDDRDRAAPAEVTLRLSVTPRSAIIEVDGVRAANGAIRVASGDSLHRVVVSAPGYATESRDVIARGDAELVFSLRKLQSLPSRQPEEKPKAVKVLKGPMEINL